MRPTKKIALVLLFIIVMLAITEVNFLHSEKNFFSVSGVEMVDEIGVYWDANCSSRVFSIDWGVLQPGDVKNVAVYVRNEGSEPFILALTTASWDPNDASQYLIFSWSSTGDRIEVGEIVEVIQTLSVSPYPIGISNFSFEIIFEGRMIYKNVAVIEVRPYRTILSNNTSTSINVTLENKGYETEIFNVTLYYNSTRIGTQTTTLPAWDSMILTFEWAVPSTLGDYTIKAVASTVENETDVEDNIFVFGNITISIPGDINHDKMVNIIDITIAARAFGTKPGDERWNSNADVNEDRAINIIDLTNIAKEYGKTP